MVEFVLKTETERRLYVDALLHCLDHGTLAKEEVLRDIEALIQQNVWAEDKERLRALMSRLEGIVVSYLRGNRDRDNAACILLQEVNEVARMADAP
ncbi:MULTISPECIES: hypothetical protein [Asticcacaulis]|uniref:hypothetical protein n=1 Tax=Asticcacaulis TaxID=76890 RepID=UPI001AE6A77B|nr:MULTISPECIES: hypothetical protein [Asticcacaulis]MBP2160457.1 hypothetical protein [Asticcacaulis solisilvae]MDR6801502.1 hypothetical protein [Asticcacaulis sp. BE141]